MNERIRKLAEQAGFFPVPDETETDWEYRAANARYEAFAVSIVRECAKVYWNIDNGEQHSEYVDALKKHFGVEEQQKVAPNPKCSVCGTTENVRYMGGYQPYLCDSVDCIPF